MTFKYEETFSRSLSGLKDQATAENYVEQFECEFFRDELKERSEWEVSTQVAQTAYGYRALFTAVYKGESH